MCKLTSTHEPQKSDSADERKKTRVSEDLRDYTMLTVGGELLGCFSYYLMLKLSVPKSLIVLTNEIIGD